MVLVIHLKNLFLNLTKVSVQCKQVFLVWKFTSGSRNGREILVSLATCQVSIQCISTLSTSGGEIYFWKPLQKGNTGRLSYLSGLKMETLPAEIVDMIVQKLSPQDLVRCSAVCREWYNVFNQDWIWKPLCDPDLEEPLRTIPCATKSPFVTPEVENSTLPPISHWKLAFMRENHLWKNWRSAEANTDMKENVIQFEREFVNIEFLTHTLVVVWYSNAIEVLDVSVMPAALVAKTHTSVNLGKCNQSTFMVIGVTPAAMIAKTHTSVNLDECNESNFSVIGATTLLVEKDNSINVFNVDIMKHSIELKHTISLDRTNMETLVKDHFYLCQDKKEFKLTVFDLNTGEMVKEEACPVKIYQTNIPFDGMRSSKTSDFVVVAYPTEDDNAVYYIYSIKQLAFLPGPLTTGLFGEDFALHGHWLAVVDYVDEETLKVYDLLTGNVLLNHKLDQEDYLIENAHICVCKDRFIFILYCGEDQQTMIGVFFPPLGTWTVLDHCELDGEDCSYELKMINNKFVAAGHDVEVETIEKMRKFLGRIVQNYEIPYIDDISSKHRNIKCIINQSFTKALKMDEWEDNQLCFVRCFW